MRTIVNSARWVFGGRSGTAATLQTLIAKLLILAVNVATGIITARTLGPVGRGEQAAMILWPQFLAYAMTLGLPATLLYNIKRHPEEETQLFSAALVLGTVLGLMATFAGILFIPQWLAQYSVEVIHFAQWFMLTAPLVLLEVVFIAALEARNDFTTANQMRYLSPLITLVVLGVLILTNALTPFTSGLAYVLPVVPIFLWILIRLWKVFHPHWHNLGKSYKRLLSYGLRYYGIDLIGRLAAQVDQVLVIGLLAPASMGMYVVALSLSRMLSVVQSSFATVLLPKTAARPIEEVVALTGRAVRVSNALTILAAIGVILLGPLLLRLLYGSDFIGAVSVFRILIVEVVISGTTWILAQPFMALGRPGTVTLLQSIGLGLSVPLMLILIPTYGLEGAGIALLVSTTVRLVFILISYPLLLKVHPPGLLITQEDWSFLLQLLKSNR